jgi:hypothetical protein
MAKRETPSARLAAQESEDTTATNGTTPSDDAVTSAAIFANRWEATYIRELSPGFKVRLKKLALTGELLRGTLPNQVLRRIRFEQQPFMDDRSDVDRQKDNYEAALPILARGMVEPRFVFGKETKADPSRGEIGPEHLSYVELDNAYFYIVKEVVPPPESAPFRANGHDGDGDGTALQPGEGV